MFMHTFTSYFQLDQCKELEYRQELAGSFLLTYSFTRSKGRQTQRETPGDDYFEFCYRDERAVFAICDGVSQGFGGHIASRFLGTKLVDWLWSRNWRDEAFLLKDLNLLLQKWTDEATEIINSAPLPHSSEVNENRRRYWEKKRAEGAQTMFVLGGLDCLQDKAVFFWLGDTRLVFDFKSTSASSDQIEEWYKMQRWSTLKGALGSPSSRVYRCADLNRVISYTDGLEDFLDNRETDGQRFANLAELKITQPCDDVSFLVLSILSSSQQKGVGENQPPQVISKTDSLIEFDDLPAKTWVRAYCRENDMTRVFDLLPQQTKLNLADYGLSGHANLSFQLISEKWLPSQSMPLEKDTADFTTRKSTPTQPAPLAWSKHKKWMVAFAVMVIIVGAISILPFFSTRNIDINFLSPMPTPSNYGIINPSDTVTTVALTFPPLPTSTTISTLMIPTSSPSSISSPTATSVAPTTTPSLTATSGPSTQAPTFALLPTPASIQSIQTPTFTPAIPSPTTTISVMNCAEYTTIADGLIFYLQPNLSSREIHRVPANQIIFEIYSLANGRWKLISDPEKPGGPIQGFVFTEDLMKLAKCR